MPSKKQTPLHRIDESDVNEGVGQLLKNPDFTQNPPGKCFERDRLFFSWHCPNRTNYVGHFRSSEFNRSLDSMRCRIIVPVRVSVLGLVLLGSLCAIGQEPPAPGRKVVDSFKPIYPDLARGMRLVGTVKIEAVVSPDGKLRSTHVLGGSPLLVQAAVAALQKWRWAPQSAESTELIEFSFHQ